jgi:aspartyl-tRNA synthetase
MERIYTTETVDKVGQKVKLSGWADTVRNHGKVVFLMLRDKEGVIQCVSVGKMTDVGTEDVIEITGTVKARPEKMVNKAIATGTVEIEVEEYKILNKAKELPIPLNTDGKDINEEMRLKYRYLDLRRERMRKIMRLRSDYVKALRDALAKRGFTEVETPMLTKSTKEGARDFIVPSRHNPGKFYALPQSPQQYKQLLMTAGVERYFQFARCIRDEDLRADRGYEHTQLDMEMSFMTQQEVMETIEAIVVEGIKAVGGKFKDEKFPVINYEDAMKQYGADKFDLRTAKEKEEGVLAFAWVVNFPFFKKVDAEDAAEKKDGKSGWVFTHNPFSSPIPEHMEWHMKGENIGKIVTAQYDLVCNGLEAGGGSIRAHQPEVLRQTYKMMGYTDEEIEEGIGHMLEAFEFGAPPHGGIGMGIDRHIMLLAGEDSLKEAIAFPMTSTGKTSIMDAPSAIPQEDLEVLHIEVSDKGDEVIEKIRSMLDSADVQYKFLEHQEVRTSEEAAKVRGTKISDGAKAMVLKSTDYEGKYVMVVVPADKQVDLNKVAEVLGEKFEVANGKEVESYTGIKMGGVPPFGRLLKMEVYFDASMWTKTESAFNCGRKDRSIIMKTADLIKLAAPNKISESSDFVS